ncbi:hypothetical protein ONZ43_g5834 [Nemania bipapillata]|uniref:Uncharacterized protein n=1 Tax=Nemania bipapillata TaxID=110536 RepID=A0ACC2I5C3_9PEZI|nr:hypothetical protein ONZ43_g5834 [Nemania bipapillata]
MNSEYLYDKMSSLEDPHGLNWLQPGQTEIAVVGKYVSDEASRLHGGFAGSSQLDLEQVKFVSGSQPYQIGEMERAYRESKQGLWHRFWYSCGDVRSIAEAWMDFIPNEYGLSVLKVGFAVVFKLAENSKDKREKVFKTFSTLQEALVLLHPDRLRFQTDPAVCKSVASLNKAVVGAIENMVKVLSYMETPLSTKFTAKLRRENKSNEARHTLDDILKALEMDIAKYDDTIKIARDHTNERTEAYSRISAVKIALVHEDTAHLKKALDDATTYQQGQHQQEAAHRVEMIEAMRGEQEAIEIRARRQTSHSSKHMAVVSLTQLCNILAQPLPANNQNNVPSLERTFQHPSADLSHALAEQGRFSSRVQGQVNSLLEYHEFLDWLSSSHPSLILVDANIRESALDHISAISVFSSTLVTSLMQAYSDTAVVIHFFCGLHASPSGAWYGPTGLVRSLILQLLMKLDARDPEMKTWDLDFINDRRFLQNLEQHSLVDLCFAFHELLYQFTPDTYVYCIIDSISSFDADRLLKDLGTVMEGLRSIVNDTKLVPIVKIFLTNPFESTREIKNMPLLREDPARLISLSPNNLVPGSISSQLVDDHLLRAPSPLRGRSPSPVGYARIPPPAVSIRKRIAGPIPVVREVFTDTDMNDDDDDY